MLSADVGACRAVFNVGCDISKGMLKKYSVKRSKAAS